GLLCYSIGPQGLEVVTIHALSPGHGAGSALIEAAAELGRREGCSRMWLVTTNDNLGALGFYLRHGMRLVTVHHDAVASARVLKPAIPATGDDGVAVTDEIELERWL
ncbi:MAG: GNAT family N-acetyltransferase, partial [Acidimicrobiales bacterium]